MLTRFRAVALATLSGALLAATPAAAGDADEPLARFEDRLCPGVAGLSKIEDAETLVGLIRANVEALGLRTGDAGACVPNLIVAFVEDGRAFLSNVVERDAQFLIEMNLHEREALLAEPGPAHAVVRVRTRSRDGMPVARREDLQNPPQSQSWMAHSRIYSATRNDIHQAMVLIDAGAVPGLSLRQLADYATFRALTRTMPPAEARAESIVSLFDGGEDRPKGLTDFDRAFLGTLYSGVPNLPGSARLAALSDATGHDIVSE